MTSFWDAVGFLLEALVLGSFAFWVIGYFVLETVKFGIYGPSEQLKSVGTSILAEEPLRASTESTSRPRAA
jgi:hypothetical protein